MGIISLDQTERQRETEREFSKGFLEMGKEKNKKKTLQSFGSDSITCEKNSPAGGQFDGIWERQIRSARTVLGSLLRTHGSSLNDEALKTLMTTQH